MKPGLVTPRLVVAAAGALLLVAPTALPAAASPSASPVAPPAPRCQVDDPRVTEASGLVATPDGRLITHEDSGHEPRLVVLAPDCSVLAAPLVVDATGEAVAGVDPEDLAVSRAADGSAVLWLGDVGDNRASRESVEVLRVSEADVLAGPETVVAERLLVRLVGGPADVETLVASPDGSAVALVEKTLASRRARVWVAPTDPLRTGDVVTAPVVAEVVLPATALGPFAVALTGGALLPPSQEGPAALVLRTYTSGWRWPLSAGRTFGARLRASLASAPSEVPLPPTRQGEAVAAGPDGTSLVTIGEGRPADVYDVRLPTAPEAPPRAGAAGVDRATDDEARGDEALRTAEEAARRDGVPVPALAAVAVVLVVLALAAVTSRRRRGA